MVLPSRLPLILLAWAALSGTAVATGMPKPLPSPTEDPDLVVAWERYQAGDFVHAAQAYGRAARRGQPIGEFNLATMLMSGQGVAPNPKRALELLHAAAQGGLAQAQLVEGQLYDNGDAGVPRSPREAVHWYELSAAQGNVDAERLLATAYFVGRGVAQDYVEAAKWYEAAAEGGDEGSQYIIASCYEHGDGVAADRERAIYWYQQAALQGDAAASEKARVLSAAEPHGPAT